MHPNFGRRPFLRSGKYNIAEITGRHRSELAMAWWRRETSPMMLLRGTPAQYADLDQRMIGSMGGAGINPTVVFADLLTNQNFHAPDFAADLVSAFLVASLKQVTSPLAQTWIEEVQAHPDFVFALEATFRWLGRDTIAPSVRATPASDIQSWHPSDCLRFIDGFGKVQGQYIAPGVVPHYALLADEQRRRTSALCTQLLRDHRPQPSVLPTPSSSFIYWITEANRRGCGAEEILLAVGVSGDPNALSWLLQCAIQPTYSVCALDAFRRISGFDALAEVGAHCQLISTVNASVLAEATHVAQCWLQLNAHAFERDRTYLLGKPISFAHLIGVLRAGAQADREIAAMRLLQEPKPFEFPVRSNSLVQHLALATLSNIA